MKKLVLLLLFVQVWALSMVKTVSGPELIDVNDSLAISINVVTDKPIFIDKIEDTVPEHFVAYDYPSSCRQTERTLVCDFGQEIQGTTSINYDVLSLGTGYGMFSSPLLYYGGGIKTINFFRSYFIGKPRIDLKLEGNKTLLYGDDIMVSVRLTNPGVRPINGAKFVLNYSGQSKSELLSLSPQESLNKNYTLGKAKKSGYMNVRAEVSWQNGTASDELSVVFISPSVSVDRKVELKWRAGKEGLASYVMVSYVIRNNGTASGNVAFLSGEQVSINPRETRVVKKTYAEKAPIEKASVTDSRGIDYGVFSFGEEVPPMKKGFFVLLYEYVASGIPPLVLIGIIIGALFFSKRFSNPNLRAGFLVIAMLSGLLIYSQYSVGAISIPKIPGFGPRP